MDRTQSAIQQERDDFEARLEAHHERVERFGTTDRRTPVSMNVFVPCPVCGAVDVLARFDVEDGAPVFRDMSASYCRCIRSPLVDRDGFTASVRSRAWDDASEWLRRDKLGGVQRPLEPENVYEHYGRKP